MTRGAGRRHAGRTWRVLTAALAALGTTACLSYITSTGSARREARRECLAAAREQGWTVLQISDATFRGAAVYDVTMTVERSGAPAQSLACSYNIRDRLSELREAKP